MDNLTILKECMELDSRGDYRESITRLDEAISTNPGESKLFYQRGIRYERLEEYSLALKDYSTALEMEPTMEYWVTRGRLVFDKFRRAEEAVEDFMFAIAADPTSPIPHQHLSLCYLLIGDSYKAHKHAEHAVNLDDKDAFSYFCKAKCDIAAKKWSSAIEQIRIATELDSKSSLYWDALGRSYLGTKDTEQAIECYKKAIIFGPSAARYIRLARIQLDLGDVEAAIENLNFAKEFELGEVDRILVEGYLSVAKGNR